MKNFSIAFVCALAAASASSCGQQGIYSVPPSGSYSNVVLVTETGKIEGPGAEMVKTLQHEIDYYVKREFQFHVKIVPASQLEKELPVKNMVLFGLANQGKIGSYIEQFIGESSVRAVLEGKYSVFKRMDYPVKGQLTVIVTAPSNEQLLRVLEAEGETIRNIIEDGNRERLREYFLKGENRELEDVLKSRYGFSLRIPSVYTLHAERPEIPGIELFHEEPHRGLAVSWQPLGAGEVSLADSNALYQRRADFAYKMYDKDVMRRDLVRFTETQLGPNKAVRMDGYWENSVEAYGGSFVTFFIADRVKARVWLVDCVVFAPGTDKHELVRELIAIAETFAL